MTDRACRWCEAVLLLGTRGRTAPREWCLAMSAPLCILKGFAPDGSKDERTTGESAQHRLGIGVSDAHRRRRCAHEPVTPSRAERWAQAADPGGLHVADETAHTQPTEPRRDGGLLVSPRTTSYVRSSTGRAPVSKTGGCRFDPCRTCDTTAQPKVHDGRTPTHKTTAEDVHHPPKRVVMRRGAPSPRRACISRCRSGSVA